MSEVAIEAVHGEGTQSPLIEEMKSLAERVRQRAFEIFQHRAGERSDLDDWFEAERELIWTPESELVEKDGKFQLQIAVPGFQAKDVRVMALPDAVVVRAHSTHEHDKSDGHVCFCEFERSMFRRIDLPEPINVDTVAANLDHGMLKLTAAKAKTPGQTEKPAQTEKPVEKMIAA